MKIYRKANSVTDEAIKKYEQGYRYRAAFMTPSGAIKVKFFKTRMEFDSFRRETQIVGTSSGSFNEAGFLTYSNDKDNDFDPKDRATLKELKATLQKASEEMDDHPGAAKYEAAYKAAEKAYNDFLEKAKTVNNSEGPMFSEGQSVRVKKSSPLNPGATGKIVRVTESEEDGTSYMVAVKDRGSVRIPEKHLESAGKDNAKYSVGTEVEYGPFKWKVTKIEGDNKYFLKQIGGSGQVAEHIDERSLIKSKNNAKLTAKQENLYELAVDSKTDMDNPTDLRDFITENGGTVQDFQAIQKAMADYLQ